MAWVGDDYTAEGVDSFLILKSDIVQGNAWFLRFMDPALIRSLTEKGRIRTRTVGSAMRSSRHEAVAYRVVDISREDLTALIREIGADALFFSVVAGPFYPVKTERTSSDAVAGGEPLGIWRVDCQVADNTATLANDCIVSDPAGTLIIAPASEPSTMMKVGEDRCAETPIEMQVDDMSVSVGTSINPFPLLEQMHIGRVLHIQYTACPSNQTKRVDLALQGFNSAFAAASAQSLGFPGGALR
jgi:hypothetical protein